MVGFFAAKTYRLLQPEEYVGLTHVARLLNGA